MGIDTAEHDRTDVTEVYKFDSVVKVVSAIDMLGIDDFRDARGSIKLHMGKSGNRDLVCASKISEDDVFYKASRAWLISRMGITCPECGLLEEE
jgi:hypothetical protein